MLGRGTRPFYAEGFDLDTVSGRLEAIKSSTKHNCLVLDYAANTRRLGPINDPVVPRRKGKGGGDAPVKVCPTCSTYNHAKVKFCIHCGAEFKFDPKLVMSASSNALLKGDNPVTKIFRVDHIVVSTHVKSGAPEMMKVAYYCGLNRFTEFVCFEHTNFAGRRARDWWRKRTVNPYPTSTQHGIELVSSLPPATHLRVWTNKPGGYPEIMDVCFNNTAFNTEVPAVDRPSPQIEIEGTRAPRHDTLDDDIPF
jgi:DNA repair protein RadD